MQKGPDGKSAYEIWKQYQPVGCPTTLEAYLDAIVGQDGKSAYEIWLAQGNVGTEDQFLSSLRGKEGKPGADGIGLVSVSVVVENLNGGQ